MQSKEITFTSSGLLLEGCLELPDNRIPRPAVVLCHPHPLYGGNMENNVIVAISQALVQKKIMVLRFNFRGTGQSQGRFDQGSGEQDDACAALSFLSEHPEVDSARLGISGYSFGGMIALSAGESQELVKAIAVVSPVVKPGMLRDCKKPKLILCGDNDRVVSTTKILKETAEMAEPKTVDIIPGVDHFWVGREGKAAEKIASFFCQYLI